LPDITVITPFFEEDGSSICFYTASRGHHMDIGGWKGTSMPPDSTELWQEGAAIKSFFLVRDNHLDEAGMCELLLAPGRYPGCTGSRRLGDNMSDLKAQIAANARGSSLIRALIDEFTKPVVHFYMERIQENAELAVRTYLKEKQAQHGASPLTAVHYLDNGSKLKMTIDLHEDGSARFDFTGISCEMFSNMNAPPAITYSALIYTLRLLIGKDIPLNQGCLGPVDVHIPKGTFLNPSEGLAVCCGNTLNSQRLVDLLLKAFGAAAGSQGCMNCFGFFGRAGVDANGKPLEGFGYNYGETICGGEGATPFANGASGVHTHITNTRTTDV
jgi:5-oxoprolinase (ATP-hydrolysing)